VDKYFKRIGQSIFKEKKKQKKKEMEWAIAHVLSLRF